MAKKKNGPVIFVRCTAEDHRTWTALAAYCGIPLAELVRRCLREEVDALADCLADMAP